MTSMNSPGLEASAHDSEQADLYDLDGIDFPDDWAIDKNDEFSGSDTTPLSLDQREPSAAADPAPLAYASDDDADFWNTLEISIEPPMISSTPIQPESTSAVQHLHAYHMNGLDLACVGSHDSTLEMPSSAARLEQRTNHWRRGSPIYLAGPEDGEGYVTASNGQGTGDSDRRGDAANVVGEVKPYRKTKRAHRACTFCAAKKLKCNGHRPCERCLTNGCCACCMDQPTKRKRGRNSAEPSALPRRRQHKGTTAFEAPSIATTSPSTTPYSSRTSWSDFGGSGVASPWSYQPHSSALHHITFGLESGDSISDGYGICQGGVGPVARLPGMPTSIPEPRIKGFLAAHEAAISTRPQHAPPTAARTPPPMGPSTHQSQSSLPTPHEYSTAPPMHLSGPDPTWQSQAVGYSSPRYRWPAAFPTHEPHGPVRTGEGGYGGYGMAYCASCLGPSTYALRYPVLSQGGEASAAEHGFVSRGYGGQGVGGVMPMPPAHWHQWPV